MSIPLTRKPVRQMPVVILVLLSTLSGCSTLSAPDTAAQPKSGQADDASGQPVEPVEINRNYSAETLQQLLFAEVAAQRNELDYTLDTYARQARLTRDASIAEQAGTLAAYLQEPEQALEMANIWLAQEPDNPNAMQLAAVQHIQLNQTEEAAQHIGRMLEQNADETILRMVAEAREMGLTGNQRLIIALGSLADKYPERGELWYMRALHQSYLQDYQDALYSIAKSVRLRPDHLDSQLFQGQLFHQNGQTDKALKKLGKLVEERPGYQRARTIYIRVLLEDGQIETANHEIIELLEDYPDNLDLKLSLALSSIETGATDTARTLLYSLLADEHRVNDVQLYLGRLEEKENNLTTAINHYLSVTGPQRIRARTQAARLYYQNDEAEHTARIMDELRSEFPDQTSTLLLIEADLYNQHKQHQKALQLLNRGLAEDPQNPDLLYSRAMTADKAGNIGQLEADLRQMLTLKPNDPTALNALGYTLADKTNRLEEAYRYIQQAYEQKPDDPAIIDSMGWIYYRMGKLDKAEQYLSQAFAITENHEIAAHYGEILWLQGKKEEAHKVWRAGLKNRPDSSIVQETMERLAGNAAPEKPGSLEP